MNNTIHTYDELIKEKTRLQDSLVLQKLQIKNDLTAIKEELHPVNIVFSLFSKLVTRDRHNPLLNIAIKIVSKNLLRRILLTRTNWFARKVITILFQNYASHAFRERADQLLFRILSWLKPARTHYTKAILNP